MLVPTKQNQLHISGLQTCCSSVLPFPLFGNESTFLPWLLEQCFLARISLQLHELRLWIPHAQALQQSDGLLSLAFTCMHASGMKIHTLLISHAWNGRIVSHRLCFSAYCWPMHGISVERVANVRIQTMHVSVVHLQHSSQMSHCITLDKHLCRMHGC